MRFEAVRDEDGDALVHEGCEVERRLERRSDRDVHHPPGLQ